VKKRLEAQTTAQIQDDVTNNFTVQEKLLELFGMHLILEDWSSEEEEGRKQASKHDMIRM
jgi:hypothetical protein